MTASVDPEVDEVAHTIDEFVWSGGINGPTVAALAVLGRPVMVQAFRARDVLAELDRRHQWRTWADGSDARTCTCGNAACDVRELLDRP